ncbi:MAG: glycosyltransferase family 2 protein [Acidobacteriota bacterium]|nr:MAG: glycosyltransferase family 2 protein [Acidobacteriota bacterium]
MSPPTITAVIPTFRRPKLLRRAIESVLAQTHAELVVAVFDNHSEDETAAVVAELAARDPRVRYHCHARNLGAVANFQAGMDAVETPWFSFLSDDDVLLPGFYEHAIEQLAAHPRARFFCGQTLIWDPHSGQYETIPTKHWSSGHYEAGQAVGKMVRGHFTWTSTLWAREVRSSAGPLLEQAVTDLPFQARAAAVFPFVVSMKPLSIFTSHAAGASRQMSVADYEDSFQRCKNWCTALAGLDEDVRRRIEHGFEDVLIRWLSRMLRLTFRQQSWAEFDRAARLLGEHGALRGRNALLARMARLRTKRPMLYRLLRRASLLRHDKRAGRAALPTARSLEQLLERYS